MSLIRFVPIPLAVCFSLVSGIHAQTPAASTAPTVKPHAGMLRYPAVSQTQIAFVYAGKVWLAPRAGGLAVPCANPAGSAAFPRFSADGKMLAFTANYDGNGNLYTIPVDGGNPYRVTHSPGNDILCGWTPDGKLLFSNNAFSGSGRFSGLFTVGQQGGLPVRFPIPYGEDAAVSPDGRYLAYTPSSTNNRTWKRYRGGWAQDIWLFDLKDKSARRITDWEGTDTLPMWSGDTIYYLSDNGPEHRLNLWRYNTKTNARAQMTKFTDYDVKWPSIGAGAIVFQHGADLMLFDINTGQSHTVEIRVPGDKPGTRPHMVNAARLLEDWSISPGAKRVAVTARGDIWTLPAKEGSPRNLTRTNGFHERDVAWSPDGHWIAYQSDATGEYEIYIMPSDGKGDARPLTRNSHTFRYLHHWSPDSKSLLYVEKDGSLYVLDIATGASKLIDRDEMANPPDANWSPDSRFVAYAKQDDPRQQSIIWMYDTQTGEKHQVTKGMFGDSTPVFDRKGEYIFYTSSRVFNQPIYDDNQTTWIYPQTGTIIAVPLRADIVSPFAPKSDEEAAGDKPKDKPTAPPAGAPPATNVAASQDDLSGNWNGTASPGPMGDIKVSITLALADGKISGTVEAEGIGKGSVTGTYDATTKDVTLSLSIAGVPPVTFRGKIAGTQMMLSGEVQGMTIQLNLNRAATAPPAAGAASTPAPPAAAGASSTPKVTIDFDGLEERGFALPIRPGHLGGLGVNAQNQLLFVRSSLEGNSDIKLFDLNDEKREEKMVAPGAGGYGLTADGKKMLVLRGDNATIQDAVAGANGEAVPTTGMTMEVDPKQEWREAYNEAWRIQRDFFYDPNMHGVNWKAIHDQYAALLDDCNSRADVSYVISEMISELNVGHAYYFGGDVPPEPYVAVGLLGADFSLENGAYRITRILRGAPWDTDAIGPLSLPGKKVKEGDYLLAVNGVPLDTKKDPWAAFTGMADRTVTLTVSSKPTIDSDARDVVVRLTGSEGNLRYRAWIEHNRQYVEKASNGRVGYIYVPDTGTGGQGDLLRQFVGQRGKDALIIDERWNGGGQIPTRFIELLNRPVTNYWALRDSKDWIWPPDGHYGPKCMLINGLSGSGGDAFPWYFRQAGLGKLIGTRTWGGLIGIGGYPSLIDGAGVTAPGFAFYKKDGTWGIEGHGVDPDIEVLDDPSKMQDGRDPQLDAAIAQMLKEIQEHPFVQPKRPAYPNKSGMGINKKDI